MRYSQRNLKSLVIRGTLYTVLIQLFKFLRHTLLIIWFHSQFSFENVLLNIVIVVNIFLMFFYVWPFKYHFALINNFFDNKNFNIILSLQSL